MWNHMDRFQRKLFVAGIAYLLGAVAVLVVMLRVEREPASPDGLLILCVVMAFGGPALIYMGGKKAFMKIGIVERIRERRRIATAAAFAERYEGIDLANTPEARALPTPIYHCRGCGHNYNKTADKMYWVDEQPMLTPGWYCNECVDKISGKSRHDRLNMESFLIMLDSDLAAAQARIDGLEALVEQRRERQGMSDSLNQELNQRLKEAHALSDRFQLTLPTAGEARRSWWRFWQTGSPAAASG